MIQCSVLWFALLCTGSRITLGVAKDLARVVSPEQPHLSGIFVEITSTTANWTGEQWTTDLAAMQAVGMTFAVLPHLARQTATPPDAECPLGYFDALFNATGLGACFTQTGTAEQGCG